MDICKHMEQINDLATRIQTAIDTLDGSDAMKKVKVVGTKWEVSKIQYSDDSYVILAWKNGKAVYGAESAIAIAHNLI